MFDVWPENWSIAQAFFGLKTAWRYLAGMGNAICLGLDYTAVASALEMEGFGRRKKKRIFAGLRIMEEAALPVLNGE